jgi:hypothetical protein
MLETRLDLARPAVGFGPGVSDLLIQVHNFWIARHLGAISRVADYTATLVLVNRQVFGGRRDPLSMV